MHWRTADSKTLNFQFDANFSLIYLPKERKKNLGWEKRNNEKQKKKYASKWLHTQQYGKRFSLTIQMISLQLLDNIEANLEEYQFIYTSNATLTV